MKKFLLTLTAIFMCIVAYAQTETINWYVNDELYATTTCESGGDITPPTIDNFGYTFEGWEPAIYDMSTLDVSINSSSGITGGKLSFSYGTVFFTGLCSITNGANAVEVAKGLSYEEGVYCWCRLTGFIPTGTNKIYEPLQSKWVFDRSLDTSCTVNSCVRDCAQYIKNNANNKLRTRLYNAN